MQRVNVSRSVGVNIICICWFVKWSCRNFWFSKLSVVHVIILTFRVLISICIAMMEWGSEPLRTRTDCILSLLIKPESWKKSNEYTFRPTNSYEIWLICINSLWKSELSAWWWVSRGPALPCPGLPPFDAFFTPSLETSTNESTSSTW